VFSGFHPNPHESGEAKHLSGIDAPDSGPDEGSIFQPTTERGGDFPWFAERFSSRHLTNPISVDSVTIWHTKPHPVPPGTISLRVGDLGACAS